MLYQHMMKSATLRKMHVQKFHLIHCAKIESYDMSLVTRKPVFGVWDQDILKPVCVATEASKRPEQQILIRLRGCAGWSNNKGADQTAWMRRLICAFVVRIGQKQVFSWRGSYADLKLRFIYFYNINLPWHVILLFRACCLWRWV